MAFVIQSHSCPCCKKDTERIRRKMEALKESGKDLNEVLEAFDDDTNICPHCEPCWNAYHHGLEHKDFDKTLAPEYRHEQSDWRK